LGLRTTGRSRDEDELPLGILGPRSGLTALAGLEPVVDAHPLGRTLTGVDRCPTSRTWGRRFPRHKRWSRQWFRGKRGPNPRNSIDRGPRRWVLRQLLILNERPGPVALDPVPGRSPLRGFEPGLGGGVGHRDPFTEPDPGYPTRQQITAGDARVPVDRLLGGGTGHGEGRSPTHGTSGLGRRRSARDWTSRSRTSRRWLLGRGSPARRI